MNKQQLLARAKHTVDERRFAAEEKAENTLKKLRQNEEWVCLEGQLRSAQVDLAMSDGNSKELSQTVENLEKKQRALLKKLKVKDTDLVPQYSCKLCGDTGYVDGKECVCLKKELRRLLIAGSNVVDTQYTFENSTETDKQNLLAAKQIRKMCEAGDMNLLLCGKVGTGKTYLLTACANLAAQSDRSVLFITAYSLNADFLNAYLDGQAATDMLLDSLIDVDLLLIDDLGTEKLVKNVTANYLFDVFNERIVRHKPTYFTTNLPLKELSERYDERIVSRLMDKKTTLVIPIVGADKRLAAKQ